MRDARPGIAGRRGGAGQPRRDPYAAGVMSVVLEGGTVRAGDRFRVELPAPPHRPLERV